MSGLFGKVVSFIMNDALVKTLANSKIFQRFAVKTDAMAKEAKVAGVKAAQKAESVAKQTVNEHMSKVKTAEASKEFSIHSILKEFSEEVSGGASKKTPAIKGKTKRTK